jgi:hypothetical protein
MSKRRSLYALVAGALTVSLLACGGGDAGTAETFIAFTVCGHKRVPWSEPDCPDSTARFMSVSADSVSEMSLTVQTTDGRTFQARVPNEFDAIFLTRMSVDSILIPYYQGRGDTAKVNLLRRRMPR